MFDSLKGKLMPVLTNSLLRKPFTYELLGDYGRFYYSHNHKRAQGIWLDFIAKKLKAGWQHKGTVVWSNAFFTSELLYGLGLIPCQPETLAALAAKAGLSQDALTSAEACGYSLDICSFYRCGLGLDVNGLMPRPDIIISTSYLCDGAVKFFHNISKSYECEHFLIDVPYDDGEKARKYLASQLEDIASKIAEKQGRSLDFDRLDRSLKLSNEAREYAIKINELCREAPCPLSGSDSLSYVLDMQLFGFGSEAGVRFFKTLYEEVQAAVENGQGAIEEEKYRLLWFHHIRPYYPNRIISHLEEMGASVCFGEANHIYWEQMDLAHPFESLAAKMLANPSGGPIDRRVKMALDLADKYNVDGVIHFSQWGCRQSCGGEYIIRDHIAKKGAPMLILHGDGVNNLNYSEEQTKLRLDAFIEMLEAKK